MTTHTCDACRGIMNGPSPVDRICPHCLRLPEEVLDLVAGSDLTPTAETALACTNALADYVSDPSFLLPRQAHRIVDHLRRYIIRAEDTAREISA